MTLVTIAVFIAGIVLAIRRRHNGARRLFGGCLAVFAIGVGLMMQGEFTFAKELGIAVVVLMFFVFSYVGYDLVDSAFFEKTHHPEPGTDPRSGMFIILSYLLMYTLGALGLFVGGVGYLVKVSGAVIPGTWISGKEVGQVSDQVFLGLALIATLLCAAFWAVTRSPILKKFTLAEGTGTMEQAEMVENNGLEVGRTGVAQSALRPSGFARLGGKRIDVVARGRFIDRGTPIRIVAREGGDIVVAPLEG